MDYSLKLVYENLNNGVLSIGKYTVVKGIPIQEYDYNKYKDDKKILSTTTRRNLDILEERAGAVFSKIYKADKSKGRNVYSTYILGKLTAHPNSELNGKEFIWARQETASAFGGTTTVFFDDRKLPGTSLVAGLSLTITKVGNLYKIDNIQDHSTVYSTTPNGKNITRDDGPARIIYYSNGNLKQEMWYTDDVLNRDVKEGPAIIEYYRNGKISGYQYIRKGRSHRPVEEGPADESHIGMDNHYLVYYQNGVPHRLDGPAMISKDYASEVYVNGIKICALDPGLNRIKRRGYLFQ